MNTGRIGLLALLILGCGQVARADDDQPFSYETITCGQMLDAFDQAVGTEGESAEETKAAREDVLYGLTWMHGYVRGARLPVGDNLTFDLAGVRELANRLSALCQGKLDAYVVDVVRATP